MTDTITQVIISLYFLFLPESSQHKRTNQKTLLKSIIVYNPNNKNWNNFLPKNYQKI